ncbi:hypothetical protein B0T22DRAFT_498147 [Podospora appendiculata]|uniref:Orc1-like AAA ATPase domain-containing protein n=1 Tax=Podospora appendiculata TaxID=314037 RepID=A0AAE0X872_9PEZI|nr:hypothetical protein B0T22DRAFT_498147 [Podospora appendiculata]
MSPTWTTTVTSQSVSSSLWADAVSGKAEALSKSCVDGSKPESVTFEAMQEHLERMRLRHESRRSTRWFARMTPVIEHLRTFSSAVGIFTQANPEIACLIWGSMKLVLDVCYPWDPPQLASTFAAYLSLYDFLAAFAFSTTLGLIVGMYESITHSMPRFQEYMDIFPHSQRLQRSLLQVYCAYLDFSIAATAFFKRHVRVHIVMSFIKRGSLVSAFDQVKSRIRDATPDKTFSVPWPRNCKFVGRKDELDRLESLLSPSDSQQRSCVLHGMAGVGKTQTALEFTYQVKSIFRHTFWIAAEDETTLAESYGEIARGLGLSSGSDVGNLTFLIEMARSWLCQNDSWLLVFDNAEASALLTRYWPPCDHGSILATTQDRKLVHRCLSEIHLTSLTEEQGSALLLQHLSAKADSRVQHATLARAISREVGGLPLLLVGLAGYTVDSDTPLADILDEMKKPWHRCDNIIESLSLDSASFHYERPLQMAFAVALSKLPRIALAVLQIMSMLSPDCITDDIVSVDLDDSSLSFLESYDQQRFRRDVRTPLVTRYLVNFQPSDLGPPSYSIHRQLQWKTLTDLKADPLVRQRVFDRSVALIRRSFPPLSEFMIPMFAEWASTDPYPIQGHYPFAELLASAGNYLYEVSIGEPGLAKRSPQAGSGDENAISSNPMDSAPGPGEATKLEATALTISWGIVSLTRGVSGTKKAHDYIQRVLQLRQQQAAADLSPPEKRFWSRVLLSNAYNDMACQLIDVHKYDDAESYLARSLELKDQLATERKIPSFEYAESKNNLACVRIGQGRIEEALTLSCDVLKLIELEGGHVNDQTRFLFIHGICLTHAGRLFEAVKSLGDGYKQRVAIFGASSRNARDSAYATAWVLYHLNKLDEARNTIELCLGKQENSLWAPECLIRAQYLKCLILQALGQKDEAQVLGSAAVAELQRYFAAHLTDINPTIVTLADGSYPAAQLYLFDFIAPYVAGRFPASGGCLFMAQGNHNAEAAR